MARRAMNFLDQLYAAAEPRSAQAKAVLLVALHWTNKLPPERRGYLERDGRPISREALAHMASITSPGGSTPDPFQELREAGLLKQEGRTFYLPHIVAVAGLRARGAKRTGAWRQRKEGRVSRNAGGGVTRRTHDAGTPPEVSPFKLSPSLPPGKDQREEAEEHARDGNGDLAGRLDAALPIAERLIREHWPDRLADGLRPFAQLVAHLGEQRALAEVRVVEKDATVKNPFAVAWRNHDPRRQASGNGRGGNGRGSGADFKSFDQMKREKQDAEVDAGVTAALAAGGA